MALGTTPYPQNGIAAGFEGIANALPLILGIKRLRDAHALKAQTLGQVLGIPSAPEMGPTLGPVAPGANVGPPGPIPSTGPMAPTGNVTYPSANPMMQPILGQRVGELAKLKNILGDTQMTNMLAGLGVGKKESPDAMQLEMGPDGTFRVKPGTTSVSARNANVIIRQKDVAMKGNVQNWRDAVEKRLSRGQLSKEEGIALRADADLLGLIASPEFDMMDDTIKDHLTSQATAAINRLQQRGVKVFTGSRAQATEPTATKTPAAPVAQPKDPATRYNEIKTANPGMSDGQIYAQMAIENAGQ